MTRVLVCGGRDYADESRVALELVEVQPTVVIHGGCRGADFLAHLWSQENGIPEECFAADWSQGKKAGPLRNAKMLTEGKPDVVVAFPGGRGTEDMVARARAAGVPVREVLP